MNSFKTVRQFRDRLSTLFTPRSLGKQRSSTFPIDELHEIRRKMEKDVE